MQCLKMRLVDLAYLFMIGLLLILAGVMTTFWIWIYYLIVFGLLVAVLFSMVRRIRGCPYAMYSKKELNKLLEVHVS